MSSNTGKHKPPTKAQLRHANRIVHRSADGLFKKPPPNAPPARITNKADQPELDQDSGGGYNPDGTFIQH